MMKLTVKETDGCDKCYECGYDFKMGDEVSFSFCYEDFYHTKCQN